MKTLQTLITVFFVFYTHFAFSQTTFEDPYGVFAIDVAEDLKLAPQPMEQVYTLKGEDYSIIIQKNVEPTTLEGMYTTAMETLIGSGLTHPEPVAPVKKMKVNGNDAQMGTYKGAVELNGVRANLHGLMMSVDLGGTYLGVMSIVNNESFSTHGPVIIDSYESIRLIGQEISGVTDAQEVEFDMDPLTGNADAGEDLAPTTVTYEELSFTLPPGWSKTPRNRSDNEMILGGMKNDAIDASCTLMGLKGLLWNRKSAILVAEQSAASALPGSTIIKNEDIRLADKQKVRLIVCQGQTVAKGNEVTLNMTFLTQKVGKYFVIYIMSNTPSKQDELEQILFSIAESAKI